MNGQLLNERDCTIVKKIHYEKENKIKKNYKF